MPDDPIIGSLNPFPPREDETEREARIRQRAFDLWQSFLGVWEGAGYDYAGYKFPGRKLILPSQCWCKTLLMRGVLHMSCAGKKPFLTTPHL